MFVWVIGKDEVVHTLVGLYTMPCFWGDQRRSLLFLINRVRPRCERAVGMEPLLQRAVRPAEA